jgi:spore coat protein H
MPPSTPPTLSRRWRAAAALAAALPLIGQPVQAASAPKPATRGPGGAKATAAAKPEAKPAPAKAATRKDESIAFFRNGVIPRLKIEIAPTELERLRHQPREYVRCTVIENSKTRYEQVGIHLKGAAGSFRAVDDRPALTVNFDEFKKEQVFHGLDKIHLNNSVQDPTYLNELLASELFQAAGVPAARTTHARVWLNGRDLGLYVLKEGFNKRFVRRHYADASGNLFDGGFVQDLDGQPRRQSGDGPKDGSDIRALIEACQEPDMVKRWPRVEQMVDIDRFLTFTAMELLMCHWDGYNRNRNNYRFYIEPKSRKIHFFPHGTDQLFGDPNFGVFDAFSSIVGNAVLSNPEWRLRYRRRLLALMKHFVPADRLLQRVDAHQKRLTPIVAELGGYPAQEFDYHVRQLKDRLTARARSLTEQTRSIVADRG